MIKIKSSNRNTNKHTQEGMELLENSINKVGVIESISVATDGTIISGHARKEIFDKQGKIPKEIKLEANEYPVILTDIENNTKQYFEAQILANTTANKNFDLDNELIDEIAVEYDIDIEEVGVEVEEFKDETFLEAEEDNFDATPPAIPITVLGDLYEIGEHRLLCGDSTDSDQVAKLMNGAKADMVFTDPPYGVDYEGINNDDREGLEELLRGAFGNMMLSTNNGGSFYCFHSDKCSDIFSKVYREFCHFSSMIIWVKESIVLSQTDYQSKHEPCMYGWFDNGTHKWYSDRKQESVWIAKSKREEGHTTPKPIDIITKALNNSSKTNHLVLDLFLGSGSTMVASHQLKRKCYGMELDPKYCDVIVKRMLKLDDTLKVKRNDIDCTNEFNA